MASCVSFICSAWTHKLITAKDHASIQINIGHLNADGTYNGQFTTFALTGKVRAMVSLWEAMHPVMLYEFSSPLS
jgi:small subunit ribosomal protein S21e